MDLTRRTFLAAVAASTVGTVRAETERRTNLGVLLYSFGIRSRSEKGFSDPLAFLAFCHARGAAGVQVPLGRRDEEYAARVKKRCAELGMYVEGIVRAPVDKKDLERFAAEIRTAKACGAEVARTVMLSGRRYEQFSRAEDYARFARQSKASLELSEPVVRREKIRLAVENHKDFRVDEMLDLLRTLGSEQVGVCVDTGNNMALLEEPAGVVESLAKYAFSVHLKDMGVEEYADGFLLAEVPLGLGVLDLKKTIATLRKANPKIRLNLEMITRDPLKIPCLTEKYWATLARVPGRDLGRMLALVRRHQKKEPLPRISAMSEAKQREAEERHVRVSLEYARKELASG
jgi:sugar phosphate isomerase/epimerase